ncbi:hypothetical protein C0081_22855 [Cohaesibacter celericrescens]|uniref:Uncharacterized protein n=2 Tax=Cohaesibacter celericrescens TaxID=2067669 RepID=A0A2N5XKV2_9HYPH|nr:hypothetical protein C0081_22855 [Cohaesibacter celericrescens]
MKIGAVAALLLGSFALGIGPVQAAGIAAPFANRAFYCNGGNESAGKPYYFRASDKSIERIDHRFPDKGVLFQLGRASKGALDDNWSFETLADAKNNRMHLYERVSMRSPSQNKHIYRTYEMYSQSGHIFMILYDGVNGARDWRIKTTRKCGDLQGSKVVQGKGRSFWSTTFMN